MINVEMPDNETQIIITNTVRDGEKVGAGRNWLGKKSSKIADWQVAIRWPEHEGDTWPEGAALSPGEGLGDCNIWSVWVDDDDAHTAIIMAMDKMRKARGIE